MPPLETSIFGFNFPFLSGNNVLPPQSDLRIIKNDLKQLLLTLPGERVMRPDFGSELRRFNFEQLDNTTIFAIKEDIARAISLFERRVQLVDIFVNADPGQNLIEISVLARLTRDPAQQLSVEIFFPGELADPPDQLGAI